MPQPAKELIALDLDGTLLSNDLTVSDTNREWLQKAHLEGLTVTLASGRMTPCMEPTASALGIDGPIIAYNGALVRASHAEGRKVLFHRPLELKYSRELIDYCRDKYLLNYYIDDKLYAQGNPEFKRFADIYATQTGAVYNFVDDLSELADEPSTKNIIVVDFEMREKLYEEWTERWGSELTVVRTNPEYLEFMHPSIDKGVAVLKLAESLRIDVSKTCAAGDADNDAAMLEQVGLGVAMANASELSKSKADVVLEFTNEEDGVAEIVKRYILC